MLDLSQIPEAHWRLLEVLGIWFAGIMTFCAVAISLYLAIHATKTKLKLTAGSRLILGKDIEERVAVVKVANIGAIPITITSYGWRIGFLKKKHMVQLNDAYGWSAQIPVRVEIGESITLSVRYEAAEPYWIDHISRDVQKLVRWYQPLWLVLWSFRADVFTATGSVFSKRMDAAFRKDINDHIKQVKELESN